MKQVLFVAAENDALKNAKVGGVADVVRDLPAALADLGWGVTVIVPSYGLLHTHAGSQQVETIDAAFRGQRESVDIWEVPGVFPGVQNLVFDHPLFAANGAGAIYFADEDNRPFATDANKFALLCAAAATFVNNAGERPDVVHLHDWHAAFYCLLREYDSSYASLKNIRTVFTIHNLSYQGIRPFAGDESSLEAWFPELAYDARTIVDPNYGDCLNPMLAGIRLADAVSTVSETYAAEICRPSDPSVGFVGGEGLEAFIADAASQGRLHGVLNGCYYNKHPSKIAWPDLVEEMLNQVERWRERQPHEEAHQVAVSTLRKLNDKRPSTVLLSIGRLVAQKASLFSAESTSGQAALFEIAESLGEDELLIVLGSGEAKYETALSDIATRTGKLLYLQGYAESLSDLLYSSADLFLMPSSFEPCGISQMLAMRYSVPCVVHSVGGLKDTVADDETGFCFEGDSLAEQAQAFVDTTMRAMAMRKDSPEQYQRIREAAAAERFSWERSAQQTVRDLYEQGND